MPKVEQLDWDNLKPKVPFPRQQSGTKNYSTYDYKEPRKGSKNGAVKTTRPPKKTKLPKPYRVEYGKAMQHLRDIAKE